MDTYGYAEFTLPAYPFPQTSSNRKYRFGVLWKDVHFMPSRLDT